MTFPTVAARATNKETTNATSWTVTLPASIANGDLLLCFVAWDWLSGDAITWPSGWTSLGSDNNSSTAADFRYKIADGTEGASMSLSVAPTGQQAVFRTWRISAGTWDTGQVPECDTSDNGVVTTPNPGSLTPTGGAKDYLWIACCGFNLNASVGVAAVASYPSGYSQTGADSTAATGGAGGGWAELELNAASEDPGSFNIGATAEGSICFTVAVHPASSAALTWAQAYRPTNALLRM